MTGELAKMHRDLGNVLRGEGMKINSSACGKREGRRGVCRYRPHNLHGPAISLFHNVSAQHGFRRALGQHRPSMQDHQAIKVPPGQIQIMDGGHDGETPARD